MEDARRSKQRKQKESERDVRALPSGLSAEGQYLPRDWGREDQDGVEGIDLRMKKKQEQEKVKSMCGCEKLKPKPKRSRSVHFMGSQPKEEDGRK